MTLLPSKHGGKSEALLRAGIDLEAPVPPPIELLLSFNSRKTLS
ncbi:MAG: hypothetical protein VYE46_00050 [Cyanobacteriota bacterium]|nr:hypothetical protein [Cyanobacteriota bacterium]